MFTGCAHENIDLGVALRDDRGAVVKSYYYFPTTANPWITTIRLRGGRIVNIDRVKKIF